ncbi:hypothetical protein [Paenibacillus sp. J2TS4]|uniref:hypothetical protein n=1 Tax=Paenibacillus sp. J2TS4 TaxID=2807194 RepID=UPI001BD145D7|nr:hypothetical protein [Paenibacillus sp. J2TS4]
MGEIIQGDTEELLEVYLSVISGLMTENVQWGSQDLDSKVNILLRMITADYRNILQTFS